MLAPAPFARMFSPDAALVAFTARALRIYCGALFLFGIQIACQITFVSIGNAPCSIFVAVLRKFILLLPLIYLMPHLFPADPTTAVYMAEPVADAVAVTCTALLFAWQFRRAHAGGWRNVSFPLRKREFHIVSSTTIAARLDFLNQAALYDVFGHNAENRGANFADFDNSHG